MTGQQQLTIDVDRAVRGANIDEALGCCVQGGEVGSDEGGQHFVASVCHQAVVLGMPHIVFSGRVVLPSIIPGPHRSMLA